MLIYTSDIAIEDLEKNGLDISRITNNKKVRSFEIWNNKQAGIYIYSQDNNVHTLTFTLWNNSNTENSINVSIHNRYDIERNSVSYVCRESNTKDIQDSLNKCLDLIGI